VESVAVSYEKPSRLHAPSSVYSTERVTVHSNRPILLCSVEI